jgi:hypothetical protein
MILFSASFPWHFLVQPNQLIEQHVLVFAVDQLYFTNVVYQPQDPQLVACPLILRQLLYRSVEITIGFRIPLVKRLHITSGEIPHVWIGSFLRVGDRRYDLNRFFEIRFICIFSGLSEPSSSGL